MIDRFINRLHPLSLLNVVSYDYFLHKRLKAAAETVLKRMQVN